jgi:hypothetical protein
MAKDKEKKRKSKKEDAEDTSMVTEGEKSMVIDEEDLYEGRLSAQAPFAKPLAPPKLNKKVLKTIKKGTTEKNRVDGSFAGEGVTSWS